MQPHSTEILTTDCCIVGGGPAGLMLGYLFARAGLFFSEHRGSTILRVSVLHSFLLASVIVNWRD